MFSQIGPLEIGIVLVIALLVFGPKRLPGLGKSLGTGMREFKDSITDDRHAAADGRGRTLAAAEPAAAEPAAAEPAAAERDAVGVERVS